MTSSNLLLILMPIAIVLIRSAGGFNVDVSSFKLHQIQQTDSMFGFSVALHRDKQSSWSVQKNTLFISLRYVRRWDFLIIIRAYE